MQYYAVIEEERGSFALVRLASGHTLAVSGDRAGLERVASKLEGEASERNRRTRTAEYHRRLEREAGLSTDDVLGAIICALGTITWVFWVLA